MSRLSRCGNRPLVSAVVRRIGRPPNLVRVAVLVFAAAVLTLGLHDSRDPENAQSENLSFLHSVVAADERVGPVISESVISEPGGSGGQIVHCPDHCPRASAVRLRPGYLWYGVLLIAGLLIGGSCSLVWCARPRAARRTVTGAAGAELLLRLCVCRR